MIGIMSILMYSKSNDPNYLYECSRVVESGYEK